ncbi:MAG: hydroxymethylbilane synthase [Candidatus Tectomicrobia bacterium]|nr:hydroxymethylbilane synthase [Candidatus Tectomicrobia bacterium]
MSKKRQSPAALPAPVARGRKVLRVGSRGSLLARRQAEGVRDALRSLGAEAEWVRVRTEGDRVLDRPLSEIGGKGVFTKEIEDALLEGRIDVAVHSLKDLPTQIPPGLALAAVTRREDPRDVFIARDGATRLADLPPGARVGTGSLRRRAQLRAFRPDLGWVDLRGNLDTRLRKLQAGEMEGVVLAAAGFARMGWTDRITEVLPPEVCLPAVGQGALALECRAEDREAAACVRGLDHPETRRAVEAERALLRRLEGGCRVPVGALGEVRGEEVRLRAVIASLDGETLVRGAASGGDPEEVGKKLAEDLLGRGGEAILREIRAAQGRGDELE